MPDALRCASTLGVAVNQQIDTIRIMAKRDPVADAIAKIAALKHVDDPAALAEGLAPLLSDKSSYVISRAADLASERNVRPVLPQIIHAFGRLLKAAVKDPGCNATLALVRAIVKLEAGYEAEDVLLLGVRHSHWEAVWGGSADLAVSVRGQSAIGLAAMGSRLALRCAVELLAEPDLGPPRERLSWTARADAARALTMIGSDGAAAVLRFKALQGDPEPNVLSDALAGVIAIERQDGLDLAERFLSDTMRLWKRPSDTGDAEAALLGIGGSRQPGAFALLERYAKDFLRSSARPTFLAAIAMTRQEAAIDYLLKLITESSSREVSDAAVKALEPLKMLPRVGDRLEEAKKKRR